MWSSFCPFPVKDISQPLLWWVLPFGGLIIFLTIMETVHPSSQPSLALGWFCRGDHTGSLMPGVWNNISVSSLAWQWELAFLGAQIPQSQRLLLRVDKYIDEKSPDHSYSYLFDCILCCFHLQLPLKFLVWSYLLSVVATCKNWTLFSLPLLGI